MNAETIFPFSMSFRKIPFSSITIFISLPLYKVS